MIKQHDLGKSRDRQSDAACHGYAYLLPDDLKNITPLDLIKRQSTDDRNACLSACVSSRVHEHRDEACQDHIRSESILIMSDYLSRYGRTDHEKK